MKPSPWDSLEMAKLVVGVLTPIAIATLGIYIHRITKSYEHSQWRSQKLIEKRLSIYDDLAPDLNDVLCYYTYVGCWKELTPPDVVALKRTIDKKIHLAAPLFSSEFYSACMDFQNACYETFGGWGQDAKLKTKPVRRKKARPSDWQLSWDDCFSSTATNPAEVSAIYRRIMEVFSNDIGINQNGGSSELGRIPANIE